MSTSNDYRLAAMASYAMPHLSVTGIGKTGQDNDTDEAAGIEQALIQDSAGRTYNVYATQTREGKRRLRGRAKAARVIERSREMFGFGFDVDHAVAFRASTNDDNLAKPSVLMTVHPNGMSRPLTLLTLDDCASIGTALGAIHRLRPQFVVDAQYPAYSTRRIYGQLTAWIRNLKATGHVPTEITDSWARIMATEGMWNFATTPVHGGFSDGDVLFDGSMITTITNWQELQINDPARDLAWIFSKLDETHRNAVLTSYGRVLGNRLDDLIMLRANLWVQMSQVGDFIDALKTGDNTRIMQFKSQVDRLAHQIAVSRHQVQARTGKVADPATNTLTVNTLLEAEAAQRAKVLRTQQHTTLSSASDDTASRPIAATALHESTVAYDATGVMRDISDDTAQRTRVPHATSSSTGSLIDAPIAFGDSLKDLTYSGVLRAAKAQPQDHTASDSYTDAATDVTGATEVLAATTAHVSDDTASASFHFSTSDGEYVQISDITGEVMAIQPSGEQRAFIVEPDTKADSDDTGESDVSRQSAGTSTSTSTQAQATPPAPTAGPDAQTLLIPLLEREERALRDAQAGLDR
ncbi:phosphotransferase [Bifidobacterium gallicum]|uniref:phosphotransferase n=1 Tax=Bifidobacterium gallicum TaxID=78342 RepID=UPI0011DDF316|nr:phosphotransferase [Bifidobacterium gallicum]